MAHILIAEDEDPIREGLVDTLESEGYTVFAVENGKKALEQWQNQSPAFDLIVLDVMMPEMSGYDVCREIRKTDSTTLILILTAKSEEIDKVVGLELGADDYVTKPFGIRELLARVAALLRRAGGKTGPDEVPALPQVYPFGAATIHSLEYRAEKDDRSARLSHRELVLIETFKRHPNQVLSRDDLLNAGWGIDYFGTTRTLDQHIAQLRKKIEADPKAPRCIVTVHGVGYRHVPGQSS